MAHTVQLMHDVYSPVTLFYYHLNWQLIAIWEFYYSHDWLSIYIPITLSHSVQQGNCNALSGLGGRVDQKEMTNYKTKMLGSGLPMNLSRNTVHGRWFFQLDISTGSRCRGGGFPWRIQKMVTNSVLYINRFMPVKQHVVIVQIFHSCNFNIWGNILVCWTMVQGTLSSEHHHSQQKHGILTGWVQTA